ncbi:MAG: lipopolysaccharide transport periplasmic protein LptA [Candidatus Binatia bacterium]
MKRRVVRLLAAGVFAAAAAGAEEAKPPASPFGAFSFTSRKQPIEITSERLDFDYKKRRTVFRGGVEVVQGDIRLESDQLTVDYTEVADQQKLQGVSAEGNVTITQGARKATGDRAVFDEKTRTLELSGRARLEEGTNQVNGDTIVVYPDESRMEVKGENSRVKLIIFPGEEPVGSPSPKPTPDGSPQSP